MAVDASAVKRYSPVFGSSEEDPNGELVLLSDFRALEEENERLRKAIEGLIAHWRKRGNAQGDGTLGNAVALGGLLNCAAELENDLLSALSAPKAARGET